MNINFELFKASQINWKDKIEQFAIGKSIDKHEIVIPFDKSELGKWYYHEGKDQFGNLPEVTFLESKFEKLHNLGKYIWESKKQGDAEETRLYLADFLILSERMIKNLQLAEVFIIENFSDEVKILLLKPQKNIL